MNVRKKIMESILEQGNQPFAEIEQLEISYYDFNQKANSICEYFITKNINGPVLVIGRKSIDMLLVFWACFKRGITYVPLDVSLPKDRILDVYTQINPSVVFYCETNSTYSFHNMICLNDLQEIIRNVDKEYFIEDINVNDVAYIMFTSGTTGKPKGISISYEGLFAFLNWIDTRLNGSKFTVINQASFGFDISIFDLYYSLMHGCKLICLTNTNENQIWDYFMKEKDVLIFSTPQYFKKVVKMKRQIQDGPTDVKAILIGGDYLDINLAREVKNTFADAKLFNLYGPTEATVVVSAVEVDNNILSNSNKEIPIGYVNEQFLLFDENDCESEYGEIVIKGKQLAIGYLGDEKQTQEKFKAKDNIGKVYYTGDYGKRIDNKIYFCGRKDMQCKVNGYRIELMDVENNIRTINVVNDVVCMLHEDNNAKYLHAYVVLERNCNNTEQEIRSELRKKVPPYMIPKRISIVNGLPLTKNGKIDRKRIANSDFDMAN